MRRFCFATAAAAAVMSTITAWPAAANLLTDPGFEDPARLTFDGPPFEGSWEGFNNGGANTTALGSANVHSGATALELMLGDASGFAGVFQDVAVTAGDEVTWSGFHALATGTTPGGTEIRIEYLDAGLVEVGRTDNLTPNLNADGGYVPFELIDVVPAGAVIARSVYAIQSFDFAIPQAVFVDDVAFAISSDSLLGDADSDDDVDGDDLIAVQTEFGAIGSTPLLGDADNDGDVDGDDLIAVQTEFGATAAVSLPEPSSAVFVVFTIAASAALTVRR